MAIDTFLNIIFRTINNFAVADVQAFLDKVELLLTTTDGGAGLPVSEQFSVITAASTGTGRWRSKTTSGGRFWDLELADATAGVCEIRIFDQNGTNIMVGGHREFVFSGAITVEMHFSRHYFYARNITDSEFVYGGIVDQFPMDDGASSIYAFAASSRNAASGVTENSLTHRTNLVAGVADHNDDRLVNPFVEDDTTGDSGDFCQTNTGSPYITHVETNQEAVANQHTPNGREFNMIWVDDANAEGSIVPMDIDDAVPAKFKVLHFHNTVFDGVARLAMRVE